MADKRAFHRFFWLLPPAAVGCALRLWNLPAQVLGGDELHPVRAALEMSLGEVLVTYRPGDHSIPLTAFYRLLLDLGVPLGELGLRLPVLVAGLAALVLLPLGVRPFLGDRSAAVFAWLLALSPMLVLYSRIVRSYSAVVLLGTLAAVAFARWHRERKVVWAACYLLAATLAVWFHLGAAPFVAAPILFALGDALVRARDRGRAWLAAELGRLAGLAAALGALFACFLLPAWPSLEVLLEGKAGRGKLPSVAGFGQVLEVLAGTEHALLTVLLLAATGRGLWVLGRCAGRWTLYGLTLAIGHFAGLAVLAPYGLEVPAFFSRYVLVLLPLALLAAAVGLAEPWGRPGPTAPKIQWGAVVAFLALLLAGGPLASSTFLRSGFAHHSSFLALREPKVTAVAMPAFYRGLEEGPVLEFPWHPSWGLSEGVWAYQLHHGQRVLVSISEPGLFADGFRFGNLVAPNPEAFREASARWLVVHLDVVAEERGLRESPLTLVPAREASWQRHALAGRRMAERLRREWGESHYADERIEVWDLRRSGPIEEAKLQGTR